MARKQTLRKAVSKAQVNVMLNRDRPDFSSLNHEDDNFDIKLIRAMNWLNEMYEPDDLQKIAAKTYPLAKEHPAYQSRQLGMLLFMQNEGAHFGPKQEQRIQELKDRLSTVEKKEPVKQERFDPAIAIRDSIEEMLIVGDFDIIEVENLISDMGSRQAKQLDEFFQDMVRDLAYSDDSEEHKAFVSKSVQSLHNMLMSKRQRKVRPPRQTNTPGRAARKVNVRHLKEWKGIKCVDPNRIPGSTMVVTFHTEHRVLNVYQGNNLDIQGASIVGYDDSSQSRRVRENKVDSVVGSVLSAGGKDRVLNIMDGLKSKPNMPRPRFADEIIILKVF